MKIEELITDNIDVWTTAIKKRSATGRGSNKKIELTGIKKLRELILELAVRGKLVPQDPNDEPTSVLLEKIAAEKAQLIKDKKIKKAKVLPEIGEDEKPFELPDGWGIQRFGNIYSLEYGNNLPKPKRSNCGKYNVYGSNGVVGSHNEKSVNNPCIIIGRKGSAGALNLCNQEGCWITDVAYSSIPPKGIDLKFAFIHFHTFGLDSLGKGIKPGLNRNEAYILVIALPPLAEQHRIVTKVDELMRLCDQLEQQTEDSITAHQTLVEILLATLITSENTEALTSREGGNAGAISFESNWTRIAEHFDTLFTTEHSIDQLKQTILQLAVMGKLVPQNPNDEPASVLLEKIAAEKEQLIKDKKIKKQKPLPAITEDEKPFELPKGWKFVRLEKLAQLITKGSSPKWQGVTYTENPEDILFVTSENVGAFKLKLDKKKFVELKFNEVEPRSILNRGDFLMNIVGASIGRTAIYDIDDLANINQAVCLIRSFPELLCSQFFLNFFNSTICTSYMYDKQVDNARPNLSMSNISKFAIPVPPLAEQHRIVKKVNELMTLCDQLKARLNDTQTTKLQLANTIVDQAVN